MMRRGNHSLLQRQCMASPKARLVRRPCSSFLLPSQPWNTRPGMRQPLLRRSFSSGPGGFDSHRSIKNAVLGLIGINTAVFVAWQYADYKKDFNLKRLLLQNVTLTNDNIKEGRYWTLLTAAFSHQNFFHFLFNTISLNAFGSILSIVPGVTAVQVLSLAIGSGIAGSTAWLYHQRSKETLRKDSGFSAFSQQREKTVYVGLGASGMVMGAGAAATCLMPFAPMGLLFIPVPIPLFILTSAYFAIDAYYLDRGDRIGHAAHLGGSIFGSLFYLVYLRKLGGVWQMARRVVLRR